MQDPFASAPATDEAQAAPEPQESAFDAPPPEAPKKAPAKKAAAKKAAPAVVEVGSDGKHVVTLKGGAGFDAPWYVIHASGLDEVEELFAGEDAARLAAVMERIQTAAKHFVSLGPAKAAGGNGGGGGGGRSNAPRGAQEPPAGTPPAPGPDWTYKSGTGKNGKPWSAWMPPRGSDEKPVWL
ncbi:ribonucleoside reductase class II [Mycobacterium phage Mundrea]|uniref:Uncharacterized protein n=1 Tax=Mycobacterium phage Mundrea TaxID=1897540 RepID=A0A1C9LYK0_9CAUD|nr:ribonucleoside reductase class II [Mycobacterium phage Mundrea]AOQ27976.1 hypothetical protein SEA_MUNDREA_48 [Mycobacterium phage Mundrea]